jgi:hypothetical protein
MINSELIILSIGITLGINSNKDEYEADKAHSKGNVFPFHIIYVIGE